ncbi:exodeoxyribonuclease V alpha subunit [Desulfocicer vacuolatum DSM 3385]|uniref:Exodeoxyribonuclease V alpha subunit n=1 Tax=Desulfocicer vacuolatum DSM 3385 TaxID=1121400 RepID=A0A1W2CAE9_9BACT|nr:ATP-dependent RecD-like DNA helicase [Desulfocicer vacuolatum]SMC82129.1 exodeoxyribonuclease V alpha subunit [Desulfocicer vacuolatum DSM 3385]
MITIKGILSRITFRNEENHYTIARIKVHGTREPVVIVGHMAGVAQGETLSLKGSWVTHVKYGEQFKVESFEVILPATVGGIKKYLGSGIIKGIGKTMADKIVARFQENALDIIENQPHRLREIQGIGKAKCDRIIKAWDSHHAVRRVMQFLQEHGIGVTHAAAILNFYGSKALEILKKNPYWISRDIPEAGFEVADTIAMKAGVKRDDPDRLKACVVHYLLKWEADGHVFTHRSQLFQQCVQITAAPEESMNTALAFLEQAGEIIIEKMDEQESDSDGDIKTDDKIYLKRLHRAEQGIAQRIEAMLSIGPPPFELDEQIIEQEVLKRLALKLSGEQMAVVKEILTHRVVVITGGPGTGKTTLVRSVCSIFAKLKQSVMLTAPTGRAARRLAEVTGRKAFTLHKTLLYDPDDATFGRDITNPLDIDVMIVDESSMVDTMLMYHLLQAVPITSVLILVGDIFQLPSVGPGNVLSDIIKSGAVKTFSLTRIFRQAEKSPIVMNAHCIRNGQMPCLERDKNNKGLSEFYFIENNDPRRVVSTILELCNGRIQNAFSHVNDIQVLTPMHKGETGTINLNQQLQSVLNRTPGGINAGGMVFKTGDKVMHLKNNYQKDVFNGDIGVVDEVVASENRLVVDYDGRLVDYDIMELDELTLAYAVSVHKSQGSEYSAVVIAITTMHYPLLQRNLLYTAMTRGKHLVILVGSRRAVEIALNNNRTDFRLSGLSQKIRA